MSIEDIFKNFGLNQKQIQVLMAAMELGSQPVSIIAKKTNLNRSTVYVLLNELAKYGFVSQFNKLGVRYFSPAVSEKIIEIAKRKKEEFEKYEYELKAILPELMARFNPYIPKAKVDYFEGLQGVKNVFDDILSAKSEIYAYRYVDGWITGQASNIVKEFDKERIIRKIKMKMIIPATAVARVYFSDQAVPPWRDTGLINKLSRSDTTKNLEKFTEIKFATGKKADFKSEIYIYDNKTASISFVTGSMFGVIIESDENSKTQKAIFDLAWGAK